jgi:hypothetical protein
VVWDSLQAEVARLDLEGVHMAWTQWKLWAGPVIGARIRIPQSLSGAIPAYGRSENPISIRRGAVGTVLDILPEGSSKPIYVHFQGRVNYSLAAQVLFRKAENSESIWKDMWNLRMPAGECDAVISYPFLDEIEIEYKSKQ